MKTYEVTVRAVVYQTFRVSAYDFAELKWQAEEDFNLYARRKTTDLQNVELSNYRCVDQLEVTT